MSEERIEYKAFRRAELSSESYRILCLLGVLGALMFGLIVRNLAGGQLRLFYAQMLVLTLAVAYEIYALAIVKKALSTERSVPRSIWYINILIDAGLPTLGLFILQIRNHVDAALREAQLQRELDRVNEDMDIARSIQQGLLPSRSPSLCGFEVAGWNQPAEQTGGDYFDWQTLPDGRLAVSLADATGHGIGPALITASCRAYARASCLSSDQDGLLENLNRLLAEDLPQNRFVTFAVAFLDPVRSHVHVLSAGHGPILLYRRATDQIENIEAQGIPLGMIAGAKYGRGTEARLASGDLLALVTDGFYEWENPDGEQFGLTRLEAVIRESRDCAAEEVIAKLRSAVESFCKGTEQKDDLTAVILKRKTKPPDAVGSQRTGDIYFDSACDRGSDLKA